MVPASDLPAEEALDLGAALLRSSARAEPAEAPSAWAYLLIVLLLAGWGALCLVVGACAGFTSGLAIGASRPWEPARLKARRAPLRGD